MATVFFMKFNRNQGALVADEMTWHLGFKYGYRPSRYGDSILNLLNDEFAEKNNFAAVYAGVGFPSLHEEVARRARKVLTERECYVGNLDKTSELVHDIFQESQGRLLNDKLRFLLGFDRNQFNRGKFQVEGKEVEIKQESVLNEARKLLKFQDKGDAYRRIFNNEGVVMGYDQANGIRAFQVDNSGRGLSFAYPFDALGTGKEIGTKMFADVSYRMQLNARRKGFSFSDGLFLLMCCYVEAYDFDNKVGGYTQAFFIDATRKESGRFTWEIHDHRAHLAAEVIRAYRWGFIPRAAAQPFIDRLLINGEDWENVESELFAAATDSDSLRKHLMGYKPAAVPLLPLS